MPTNQLFSDWVTGDIITATKLNQMKNDVATLAMENPFTADVVVQKGNAGIQLNDTANPNDNFLLTSSGGSLILQSRTGTSYLAQLFRVAYDGSYMRVDTNSFRVADGTVTAPGYAFQNDTNTGIYRSGADAFSLVTGGVERVSVSNTEVMIPHTLNVSGRLVPTIGRPSDMSAVWGTGTENSTGLALFDHTSSTTDGPGFWGIALHVSAASNRAFQFSASTGSVAEFKVRAKNDQTNSWKSWFTLLAKSSGNFVYGDVKFADTLTASTSLIIPVK